MSFGKRGSGSATQPPAPPPRPSRVLNAPPAAPRLGTRRLAESNLAEAEPGPDTPAVETVSGRALKPLIPLARIRRILAIVALIGGSYVMMMTWAGRQLERNFDESFSGAPQTMASAPTQTGTKSLHRCETPNVRRVWYGGGVHVTPDLTHTIAQAYGQYAQMADYVSCLMASAPQRLCKASERSALATDLKTYAQLRDDLNAIKQGLMRPPSGRMEAVVIQMISDDLQMSAVLLNKVEETDDDVVRLVKRRAADGHIRTSDFGWFGLGVPKGFSPALTVQVVSACQ